MGLCRLAFWQGINNCDTVTAKEQLSWKIKFSTFIICKLNNNIILLYVPSISREIGSAQSNKSEIWCMSMHVLLLTSLVSRIRCEHVGAKTVNHLIGQLRNNNNGVSTD